MTSKSFPGENFLCNVTQKPAASFQNSVDDSCDFRLPYHRSSFFSTPRGRQDERGSQGDVSDEEDSDEEEEEEDDDGDDDDDDDDEDEEDDKART